MACRTSTSSSSAAIDVGRDALRKPHVLDELEIARLVRLRDQRQAAPEHDGMNDEAILVDQIELHEALRERRTTKHKKDQTKHRLQLRDLVRERPSRDARMLP